MKELILYAGSDYKWGWSLPDDGTTPQLQMEIAEAGVEKIAAVFGPKFEVAIAHEPGEPERVIVRQA